METLTKTVLSTAFVLSSIIIDGIVIKILWAWFIMGTFTAPELTSIQAIGIAVIINYLKSGLSAQYKPDEKTAFLQSLLTLFFTSLIRAGLIERVGKGVYKVGGKPAISETNPDQLTII